MKFFEVWHDIARQNKILKLFSLLLSFLCLFLVLLSFKLSSVPTLLIERSCKTLAVQPVTQKHTKTEIKQFLNIALSSRFNSETQPKFLSLDEVRKKSLELSGLNEKGIDQLLIIREIKIQEGLAKVKGDRLLSYKKVRAATAVEMNVTFNRVDRSYENPYGLVLTEIKFEEADKDEK